MSERICEYIKVLADFFGTKLIVFLNLHSYLEPEDLIHVYKTASYHKVYLFMLEGTEYPHMQNERIQIVDKDRCVIISNADFDML